MSPATSPSASTARPHEVAPWWLRCRDASVHAAGCEHSPARHASRVALTFAELERSPLTPQLADGGCGCVRLVERMLADLVAPPADDRCFYVSATLPRTPASGSVRTWLSAAVLASSVGVELHEAAGGVIVGVLPSAWLRITRAWHGTFLPRAPSEVFRPRPITPVVAGDDARAIAKVATSVFGAELLTASASHATETVATARLLSR